MKSLPEGAATSRPPANEALPSSNERPSPYEALKQAILRAELAPRQPLVETALASWLQVSRTPIREALNRLEQDGLVERGDRGLVVRHRSPEEVLDIYETRIALEALVGRTAAERRTDYDLHVLRRLLESSSSVDATDDDAMVEANRQFHRAIWRASHNECLRDILERLDLHLARYPATTLSYPGRWAQAIQEHAALVSAIEARDSAQADDLSLTHFTRARDIRLKLTDEGYE